MSFSVFRKLTEHFSIIAGLFLAAGVIFWMESNPPYVSTRFGYSEGDPMADVTKLTEPALTAPRALSTAEFEAAQTAWAYFEAFTNPNSGLSNSVESFPSGTLWDQGSYLSAIICAYRLGIIDKADAKARASAVLATLKRLPLVEGQLPNKVYNTDTLEMTFYNNAASLDGLGWSALDIARLSVPLFAVSKQFPEFAGAVNDLHVVWRTTNLVRDGELWGAARDAANTLIPVQEGRLGYEEYGAKGLALLGLNTARAGDYRHAAQTVKVENILLLADLRDKENSNASNYVTSEPYLLTAFEFGLDPDTELLARGLYQAQANRADRTGILTAVSEDNIDQDPYFLYYSAFANGARWSPINPNAKAYPDLATVSTKAAFGWHALFETEYTSDLITHIGRTRDEARGWRSGVYEVTGEVNDVATANTNGMVLLALHYRTFGPLVPAVLRGQL
ncbi:MAG: DUF3131 domain-containing protein [Pseudomonadota bacterium]